MIEYLQQGISLMQTWEGRPGKINEGLVLTATGIKIAGYDTIHINPQFKYVYFGGITGPLTVESEGL